MKTAIIGSRNLSALTFDVFSEKIPIGCSEIVTGGAKGVDALALFYAKEHQLKTKVFLPDYKTKGKAAPIARNLEIIDYADCVIAFWDGKSSGTAFVISECCKIRKPIQVYII